MVDLANVTQAMVLKGELQSISVALDNLEKGGRIIAMSIAPPVPEQPEGGTPITPSGVEVSTTSIEYPPQMVTSIKQALTARQAEIAKELSGMGITGVP